jgi:hypothetical protein
VGGGAVGVTSFLAEVINIRLPSRILYFPKGSLSSRRFPWKRSLISTSSGSRASFRAKDFKSETGSVDNVPGGKVS